MSTILPPRTLFFGVRAGERGGHFLHGSGPLRSLRERDLEAMLPGTVRPLDGRWCWPVPRTLDQLRMPPIRGDETQGRAFIHYRDGWTILSWWDRSGDSRGGCCAVFLVEGRKQWGDAVLAAVAAFSAEFARMRAAYPIELAGPDLPPDGTDEAAEAFMATVRDGLRALHPEVQVRVRALLRQEMTRPPAS